MHTHNDAKPRRLQIFAFPRRMQPVFTTVFSCGFFSGRRMKASRSVCAVNGHLEFWRTSASEFRLGLKSENNEFRGRRFRFRMCMADLNTRMKSKNGPLRI